MGIQPRSANIKCKSVQPNNADVGIPKGDDPNDLWNKTRKACVEATTKAFLRCSENTKDVEFPQKPHILAKEYEVELHKKYHGSVNEYKRRFRKDLTAIRNPNTLFAYHLLTGNLSVSCFASLEEEDLISFKQKEKNTKLLDTELKNTMGKQFPTNINQIQNQNNVVPEQWGIPESAAKIDPEFDLN